MPTRLVAAARASEAQHRERIDLRRPRSACDSAPPSAPETLSSVLPRPCWLMAIIRTEPTSLRPTRCLFLSHPLMEEQCMMARWSFSRNERSLAY